MFVSISFNCHKLEKGLIIVNDEARCGSCATIAIATYVEYSGNSSRYLIDAMLQKSETARTTEEFMKRVVKTVSSSKVKVGALVTDRNNVNVSASTVQTTPLIFCCMHDVGGILKTLKKSCMENECFAGSNDKLLLQIANALATSEYKLVERFIRLAEVPQRAEREMDKSSLKISKEMRTVVTVMASLARCLQIFSKPLNASELQKEREFLTKHLKIHGIENLLKSTQQHLTLSALNGNNPYRIIDLTHRLHCSKQHFDRFRFKTSSRNFL